MYVPRQLLCPARIIVAQHNALVATISERVARFRERQGRPARVRAER